MSRVFVFNVAITYILVPISIVTSKTFANLIFHFVLTMAWQASIFFVLGLTMDRLCAVKMPLKYRIIKTKVVIWFCIFLWVICFPIAIVSSLVLVYANRRNFNKIFLTSIIFLGIVIIAVAYIFILQRYLTLLQMEKMDTEFG